MQFHQYDPNKDTLKVGTVIRLGGREGEIKFIEMGSRPHKVCWGDETDWLDIENFPSVEIGEEELTITKRLKEEIKSRLVCAENAQTQQSGMRTRQVATAQCDLHDVKHWLDSLKEVD